MDIQVPMDEAKKRQAASPVSSSFYETACSSYIRPGCIARYFTVTNPVLAIRASTDMKVILMGVQLGWNCAEIRVNS